MSLKGYQPKSVFAGDAHSACISFKEKLLTWGKGSYGRLGHGFTNDIDSPALVEEIINKNIVDVALGASHTFALCSENNVFAWGECRYGKLGFRGKLEGNLILPTPIPSLRDKKIIEISAGAYHTLALNSKGGLLAWGNSRQGKLGVKGTGEIDIPTKVYTDHRFGTQSITLKDVAGRLMSHPKQPKANADEDFNKNSELFKRFDDFMKLKFKENSNKSIHVVQVAITEKQTLFLCNSGELYGCGSSENEILATLEDEENEEQNERMTLDFLPADLKND